MVILAIKFIKDVNTKYTKTSLHEINTYSVVLKDKNYEIIDNYIRYCELLGKNVKYGPAIFLNKNLLVVKYQGNTNLYTNLTNISYNNDEVNIDLQEDTYGCTADYLTDIYVIPIKKNIKKVNLNIENINYYNHSHSNFEAFKPIIYLYPQNEKEIKVKLGKEENLLYTYPKYQKEWSIIAKPNGDLVDITTKRNLYALYWEGKNTKIYDNTKMNEGFCVKGEDTIKFLEEKLAILGLNEREAEEFIIYWLPKMESNKYNYIRFQTKEEIEQNMPLEIKPNPDTIIRIMMEFKVLDEKVKVTEQKLETPKREGFVAIEWGGTEIK